MKTDNTIFGRIYKPSLVSVLHNNDGAPVTHPYDREMFNRIHSADGEMPDRRGEFPSGFVISVSDANKIGLEIET